MNKGVATLGNTVLQTAGGRIVLRGSAEPKGQNLQTDMLLRLEGVAIDSLFYIFDNFDQTTLQQKNIKGQLFANIKGSMLFNNKMELNPNTVVAQMDIKIENGELVGFEPLQALNKFVDGSALNHLRFKTLENSLSISQSVITIPDMEIRSNAINLGISGTHTFSQQMDYSIRVPWQNFKKEDKDARFGVIAEDTLRGNIYLTLTGTPDNMNVSYDKGAVKNRIKEGLRQEKQEFKNLFKKKENQPEHQPKRGSEEFFDFDKPAVEPED